MGITYTNNTMNTARTESSTPTNYSWPITETESTRSHSNMANQTAGLIRTGSARSLSQSSEASSIVPCDSTDGELLREKDEQPDIIAEDHGACHYDYVCDHGFIGRLSQFSDEDLLHDQAYLKSMTRKRNIPLKAAIISIVVGLVALVLIRGLVSGKLFGYKLEVSREQVAEADSRIASIFGYNGEAFYSIQRRAPGCTFDTINVENQDVITYALGNVDCESTLQFRAAGNIVCYKRSLKNTLMKESKCVFRTTDGQSTEEKGHFVGFLETENEGPQVLLEKYTNQPILMNSYGKRVNFLYYEELNTYHHLRRSYVDRSNITLLYGENYYDTMTLVTSDQSNSKIRRSSKEKHLKYPEDRINGVWVVNDKTWIYLCIRDKCWIEVWKYDTLERVVSYGGLDKWRDFVGFASKDKLEIYALEDSVMQENLVFKYNFLLK